MIPSHTAYVTLVFDCDGVVLDSNRIKTEAFRTAALPWGVEAADALVNYHVANGGVSRYAKFRYFLDEIVPLHGAVQPGLGFDELLIIYGEEVRDGLISCPVARNLAELRKNSHASWLIVSGGDQTELRKTFKARKLDGLFDGGIFGSPDTKHEIIKRELASGRINRPALFLGDSKLDYEAASAAELDFIFVSEWTEVLEWRDFVMRKKIAWIPELASLSLGIS